MAKIRRTRSSAGGSPAAGGTTTTSGAIANDDAARDDAQAKRRAAGGLFNPLWCYHGFQVAVLALTFFGVIMVFSSSVVSLVSADESPWRQALTQGIYCVLGLIAAAVTMHVPASVYRRFGFVAVVAAGLLQALTLTPLGIEVNGNKGWIGIEGVFTMQPAEVMKLALCIWLPSALLRSRRQARAEGMRAYRLPVITYFVCLALVMAGKDMGTGLIIVAIGVVAFLLAGFPLKWFLIGLGILAVGAVAFIMSSASRRSRILAAYQSCDDTLGVCYQATRARYAIASGGLFGVGIGNSREKWDYLPAAQNDFIFAIIGEETGFIGAALVILLFVIIAWCLLVMALHSGDRYISIVLMCVATWIVGQALVNIGVVVGLLPVMGVPLPFVSAGGSSLIMCLAAAGVASSMMREQPQIKAESSRA